MLLDKDEVPEERQVKRLMRQILDGLIFLHSINVAHLDIKVRHCCLPTVECRDLEKLLEPPDF
jgi:serine/threonine protein kinase